MTDHINISFDGADASTVFTDTSAKAWTAAGSAQLDTEFYKVGSASGKFDGGGGGDLISTPHHTDFNIGTGDFTIDFMFRASAFSPNNKVLCTCTDNAEAEGSWIIFMSQPTYLTFYYKKSGGARYSIDITSTMVIQKWYHYAIVRSAGVVYCFLNGILNVSSAFADSMITTTFPFTIGNKQTGLASQFPGHIDEFRFINGTARWTADFVPPGAPYENLQKIIISG